MPFLYPRHCSWYYFLCQDSLPRHGWTPPTTCSYLLSCDTKAKIRKGSRLHTPNCVLCVCSVISYTPANKAIKYKHFVKTLMLFSLSFSRLLGPFVFAIILLLRKKKKRKLIVSLISGCQVWMEPWKSSSATSVTPLTAKHPDCPSSSLVRLTKIG